MLYVSDKKNTKNLWLIFFILLLSFTLVLSILTIFSWTYLTGFLMGAVLSVSSYLFNEFVFSILLSKRRTFKSVFFLVLFKFFVWTAICGGVFIGILYANKSSHISNNNGVWYWVDGMFNIFLFIVGSSIIMISIFVNYIAELIMNRKKTKRMVCENENVGTS